MEENESFPFFNSDNIIFPLFKIIIHINQEINYQLKEQTLDVSFLLFYTC